MEHFKVPFDQLLPHEKNQVRAILARVGGNPRTELFELYFVSKPLTEEQIRSVLEAVGPTLDVGGSCPDDPKGLRRSHPPSRAFREDFEGLPPTLQLARRDFDPDGDDDAWH